MPQIRAQVVIPHFSTLAEDAVVQTFHFAGIDDLEDMGTAVAGRLESFYQDTPSPASNPLVSFLSGELDLDSARCKMYDLADPEPRVPFADFNLGLDAAERLEDENLPGEVALCLSYRAEIESGTLARRRRGRTYLGPFNTGALAGLNGNPSRPSTALISTLTNAGRVLAEASTLGARWSVYSRVNSAMYEIVHGWVDNAWDTQRRRGVAALTRNAWTVETQTEP